MFDVPGSDLPRCLSSAFAGFLFTQVSKPLAKATQLPYRSRMEPNASASLDVNACESGLDANWNERKHLIEREFELRLKIQEMLVKTDPGFQQLREDERACKAALQRNDEEYESLVRRWIGELFPE